MGKCVAFISSWDGEKENCRRYTSEQKQFKCWNGHSEYVFVCLFWWFHHTRELFTPMETIPISVRDGNFANAQYSWPLSSEGSMACNTYCDTGHPWNSYLLAVKLSLSVLTTWFCPACDTKTQHSAWETNVLTDSATAVAYTFEMNMIATKKNKKH